MATTRIYAVDNGDGTRLVRAANKAQAIHHVAKATITAEVADQETLLKLAGTVRVEDVGAEPAGETA